MELRASKKRRQLCVELILETYKLVYLLDFVLSVAKKCHHSNLELCWLNCQKKLNTFLYFFDEDSSKRMEQPFLN